MDAAKRRIEREVKYEGELNERLKKITRIESNRKEKVAQCSFSKDKL